MIMTELYAYAACAILLGLSIFQLALICGAPVGKYAWGGSHRVLPTKLRIGSVTSIVLYTIFALIILEKAAVINLFESDTISGVGIWILTAYFLLGIFMNGISRSKHERAVMTPVAFILAILCLLVARG